jgi:hypothetical protein
MSAFGSQPSGATPNAQTIAIIAQARIADTLAAVAKREKRKAFTAVKAVKAMARERIGAPPPEKVVPDRKKKEKTSEKHKPTLGRLLQESE